MLQGFTPPPFLNNMYKKIGNTEFHISLFEGMDKAEFIEKYTSLGVDLHEAWSEIQYELGKLKPIKDVPESTGNYRKAKKNKFGFSS